MYPGFLNLTCMWNGRQSVICLYIFTFLSVIERLIKDIDLCL